MIIDKFNLFLDYFQLKLCIFKKILFPFLQEEWLETKYKIKDDEQEK